MNSNYPSACAYFELLKVMRDHLRTLYPGKVVSIEENESGTPCAVCVFGIGEHGVVRYALDYENHDLAT